MDPDVMMEEVLQPPVQVTARDAFLNHIADKRYESEQMTRLLAALTHNDVHAVDESGRTLLHYAASLGKHEVARRLLTVRGCEVDPRNALGRTPLMLALTADCADTVETLLEFGADVDAAPDEGQLSALQMGFAKSRKCSPPTVRLLVQHLRNKHPGRAESARRLLELGCQLREAVCALDARLLKMLMKRGMGANLADPETGWTALHEAVELGHLPSVRVLLRNGAEVNARQEDGATPIYHAYSRHSKKENSLDRLRILRALARAGASLDTCLPGGIFHVGPALSFGGRAAVSLLLSSRMNLAARDEEMGSSVLHYVAKNPSRTNFAEVLRPLVKKLNVDARDARGRGALYYAAEQGHPKLLRLMLGEGAEPECRALYAACRKGRDESVEMLLRAGANSQCQLRRGEDGPIITLFDIAKRQSTRRMLVEQMAMLETSDGPLIEVNASAIESRPSLARYLDRCRRVLGETVCGTVTLYQLMTTSARAMTKLLNNGKLRLKLKRLGRVQKLKTGLPFYFSMASKRVREALYSRALREETAPIICALMHGRINQHDLVTGIIMNYLDNEDLKNLLVLSDTL